MTTENNALTLEAVSSMVDEFRKGYLVEFASTDSDIADQIAALDTKRNDLTYDMIAALVELAMQLDVEAQAGGYKKFLVDRNIREARDGNNRYLPFIKAIFAEKKGDDWVFPDHQRGREKHANHVRYLVNAKEAGLITGSVQDFIRDFDQKLKGIEAEDRKQYPNKAQARRVANARDRGHRAAPLGTFQTVFGHKDGDVVKLMGRVRDGQLEVLEAAKVASTEADSLWYRLGKDKK